MEPGFRVLRGESGKSSRIRLFWRGHSTTFLRPGHTNFRICGARGSDLGSYAVLATSYPVVYSVCATRINDVQTGT